ncbi:MAG TPA: PAS domain-containing protein [Ignavibacteriales bacterium]|nr:PAS domain-containing protein [Ignavibacteriales bacterium]
MHRLLALQERRKHYSEMISNAQDALKLCESRSSGLTVEEVKKVLGDLHVKLIDMEIANDDIIRAQRELEKIYNKYARLFDSSPVGLLTLDSEGLIIDANAAFADIIGMERRILIRRNFGALIHAQDDITFKTFFGKLGASISAVSCEIRVLKESLIYNLYVTGVKLYKSQDTRENFLLTVSIL